MDVWRISVAALRRWYIFLPLLALSALVAYAVGNGVRPQYEATATVILVPGIETSQIDNPYGGVGESGEVLAILLDGATARDQVEGQGLNRDYEFLPRTLTRIMDFSVLGETPEEGVATGEAVLSLAREELASSQDAAGIPEEAQMRLETLQAPFVTDTASGGKLRSMAIVGILGAAFALLAAVLVDDLMGLRKRRAAARAENPVGSEVLGADILVDPAADDTSEPDDAQKSDRPNSDDREDPVIRTEADAGARHRAAAHQDA